MLKFNVVRFIVWLKQLQQSAVVSDQLKIGIVSQELFHN